MNNKMFELIDGILAGHDDGDQRGSAKFLLDLGSEHGHLREASVVIGRRFAIRPDMVMGWYSNTLIKDLVKRVYQVRQIEVLGGVSG